jgi:hypothetical protein
MRITGFVRLCCALAGCGGNTSPATPDATADAADAADAGPCGAERFVTGELVDLDSTTRQFMGVFNARLTVEGMPARTATTAPNGRFELCVPVALATTFDVDAPGAYLDGKTYIEHDALFGTAAASFRVYTQARGAQLYAFNPGLGHILVFLAGDRGELTLDRAHGPPLSGNDDNGDGAFKWSAGNSGRYVLFPNVDVSSPTVALSGDFSGPHPIPVVAGKLTLVAITFVALI